jgi:xanthine dehydrogenase accessory factor
MLVREAGLDGTIGGGHLELRATEIARGMLRSRDAATRRDRFALGATLGQCCGGAVELWFERFSRADLPFLREALGVRAEYPQARLVTRLEPGGAPQRSIVFGTEEEPAGLVERLAPELTPLWLFGAGHVGASLVQVLGQLAFRVTWVDGREGVFPPSLPDNVRILASDAPQAEVATAPAGAFYLVLTHSHDLDYEIVRAILARGDFAWAGLIGSETKARRFRQRLAAQGTPAERLARLVSPIGIDGIHSKLPGAIAVAAAAQLQQALETRAASAPQLQRSGDA